MLSASPIKIQYILERSCLLYSDYILCSDPPNEVIIVIVIIIIIINRGQQCNAERERFTPCQERPQPHNTPMEGNKRMGKR